MVSIAIDGPAGAGKSTIARAIAERLGYIYVDTGALYRAVGLYATANGIETTDEAGVERLLMSAKVELRHDKSGTQRVYLNGYDVSEEIAMEHNVVMDGRDIGTVVLPRAQVKIFLTASVEDRARRRFDELTAKGRSVTYEEVLEDIRKRDESDTNRAIAPLKQARDALLVDTTGNTLERSIDILLKLVKEQLAHVL